MLKHLHLYSVSFDTGMSLHYFPDPVLITSYSLSLIYTFYVVFLFVCFHKEDSVCDVVTILIVIYHLVHTATCNSEKIA